MAFVLLVAIFPRVAHAAPPPWWADDLTRIINPSDGSANFAPVNLGQLKHVAAQARRHLDIELYSVGGAGPALTAMVAAFEPQSGQSYTAEQLAAWQEINHRAVTLGQLKAIAKPFYDRLLAVGYNTRQNLQLHGYPATWTFDYPWNPATPPLENYAPVNIGQMKAVFSFDLRVDSDHDGLPDWWENALGSDPQNANPYSWRIGTGESLLALFQRAKTLAAAQEWAALQQLINEHDDPSMWEHRPRLALWQWYDAENGSLHLHWSGVADAGMAVVVERETAEGVWTPVRQTTAAEGHVELTPTEGEPGAGGGGPNSGASLISGGGGSSVNYRLRGAVTSNESLCRVKLMKASAYVSRYQPGFPQFTFGDLWDEENNCFHLHKFYLRSIWEDAYHASGTYANSQESWYEDITWSGSNTIDLASDSSLLLNSTVNDASWGNEKSDYSQTTTYYRLGGGLANITKETSWSGASWTTNTSSTVTTRETDGKPEDLNVNNSSSSWFVAPDWSFQTTHESWSYNRERTLTKTPAGTDNYWVRKTNVGNSQAGDITYKIFYRDGDIETEAAEYQPFLWDSRYAGYNSILQPISATEAVGPNTTSLTESRKLTIEYPAESFTVDTLAMLPPLGTEAENNVYLVPGLLEGAAGGCYYGPMAQTSEEDPPPLEGFKTSERWLTDIGDHVYLLRSEWWVKINDCLPQRIVIAETETIYQPGVHGSSEPPEPVNTRMIEAGSTPGRALTTPRIFSDVTAGVINASRQVSVSLLPVELDSRDRAISGFIPNIDPTKPMKLAFGGEGKDYGTYEILLSGSSNDVYVYESADDIFSDGEAAQYKNGSLPEKAWQQQVVLVRDGNGIRFHTVADKLGEFKITLYSGNQKLGEITHQLTEDKGFARLISAAHGMIAGETPPAIQAWQNDPDPFAGDDTILPAPPTGLTASDLAGIVGAAPASVTSAFPNPNAIRSRNGFNQFVNLVREHTTEAEWLAFAQMLTTSRAAPAPPNGQSVAAAAAAGSGGWWESWWSEKPGPRLEIALPAQLTNRGLVAKCLIHWTKKLIVANVAVGEGVVFGLWDGLKSDVEGVGAVLRMPVDLIEKLADPWGAASEIYHSFKVIKDLGWDGCKQQVIGMFNAFLTEQEDRLEEVLGDQCKDPVYFGAYMGGYLMGYVGEQVVGALITAGTIKAGWIGKAVREGAAVVHSVQKLSDPLHHFSKAFAKVRSRYTRTADELRAMRAAASKCGPEGYCLVAGTLVLMADHSFKKIDDFKPGDWVWADDPADDKPAGPVQVQFQTASFTVDPIEIDWDIDGDGRADGSVRASGVHPFYVEDVGWIDADKLQAGQRLTDESGRLTTITAVNTIHGRITTYDLGLDKVHGFFAGAASGSFILTHNALFSVEPYWKEADIIPGSNPPGKYRKHHFFYDAWLAVRYEGLYQKGRRDSSFPAIQVTPAQHQAMHDAADDYFLAKFGVREEGMGPYWKEIDPKEMEKVAKQMAQAGGIPKTKVDEVMNKQNQWFLCKLDQVFGCIRK